jgi:predicted transposase YdaD
MADWLRRKNDILLKSAFEEAFSDLLRFFFDDADAIFQMEKGFEFMDKELRELFPELEKKGGSRYVDMLARTYLKDGSEEWILIHLEIEGGDAKNFGQRMFQYYYRILDRFEVEVAALAVFTGDGRQKVTSAYKKDFLGTRLTYEYKSYHILDHTEEELLAMENPFALIVLAAQKSLLLGKIPEEELGEQRLTIARALIASKKYDSEQIRRFIYFLKTYIYVGNPEINSKFDTTIALLTKDRPAMGIIETIKMITREEGREEGLEEGIEKGIEKGVEQQKRIFVKTMLLETNFDSAKIAALADVAESLVIEVKKELEL